MKIRVDGITGKYNADGLTICKCGKHYYPSKKMFVDFLKKFKNINASVDIWSVENWDKGIVTIKLELKYKTAKAENGIPPNAKASGILPTNI